MKRLISAQTCQAYAASSKLEWLLTNGIGGFATGTVSGASTRRYHGHLVSEESQGKVVLLSAIEATLTMGSEAIGVSTNEYEGAVFPQGFRNLESCEVGIESVTWMFQAGLARMSKEIHMIPGENSVRVIYTNEGSDTFTLGLKPLVCYKPIHDEFHFDEKYPESLRFFNDKTVIEQSGTKLSLYHTEAQRSPVTGWFYRFRLAREADRGMAYNGDLFCPVELTYKLKPGESAVIFASTESKPKLNAPRPLEEPLSKDVGLGLNAASSHYLVSAGESKIVMAGWPWHQEYGRDTMISLPGMFLSQGKTADAKEILTTYASQMKNGLIPVELGSSKRSHKYDSADTTLWFAHAVHLTLARQQSKKFAKECYIWLREIFEHHKKGTRFGIGMDENDCLLRQGEPGTQLTWMNAKMGDWPVTPRHGKPIEVNGLWVNFLWVLHHLAEKLGEDTSEYEKIARKAERSMQDKFWHKRLGYFLDTVEPDDGSLRPNQLIAMSLPFAPLKGPDAQKALQVIEEKLLTPYGLRSLSPENSNYKSRYEGSPLARDAAYHQGTVWPWLLGPYVSAVIRVTGDLKKAEQALERVTKALDQYGIHGIAEVYDGDAPHRPGGSPWQAWSLAEILRVHEECRHWRQRS